MLVAEGAWQNMFDRTDIGNHAGDFPAGGPVPPDYSALVPWGLVTSILAVGTVLSVLATRRLERPVAWLCAAGCFLLLGVHLVRFLSAADVVAPARGRVLDQVFGLGSQFTPFVEALGLVLVITAALRGRRTAESPTPVEPRPGRPRGSFLLSRVSCPVWVFGTAVVLVVGALVTVAAVVPTDDAVPRLVRGAVVEHVGEGFRFVADDDPDDPEVYWPNSRFWVDDRGAQRNGGTPTCLRADAVLPTRVELAFLDVKGGRTHTFGDFPYLLSVRCLG